MNNTPVKPLFTMSNGEPRRKRLIMKLFMLVMIVGAVYAAFEITSISSRKARRMMTQAAGQVAAGEPGDAAHIYERIARAEKVDPQLRLEANRQLVQLYRGPLADTTAALAAQGRIESMTAAAAKTPAPAAAAAATTSTTTRSAAQYEIVARVGDEAVTLEQILYAWGQFNGNRPPKGEEFKGFVSQYLDMVLMADEAQRRGLDKKGQLALDLQLNRLVSLNKAMTVDLINKLPAPGEKDLIDYAQKKWGGEGETEVELGLIVVEERSEASLIQQRAQDGADFVKLAGDRSVVFEDLPDGYKLGRVSVTADEIKMIGRKPGLAARLAAYVDGATTGPIKVEDGWGVVKILGHKTGRITSIAGHEDEVIAAYQRDRLAVMQQAEVNRLRRERKIEIVRPEIAVPAAPEAAPANADGVTTATAP
ncbi:MAG: peptidylprolyl isomerase [Candidatus Sumerlaeia bacterium]